MSQVYISDEVVQAMIGDGEQAFPNEGCGFLYGKEEGSVRQITAFRAVSNTQPGDKRKRFLISPKDYVEAERHAATIGLDLIGIYHSHPNHPAIASETDRQSAQPFFSYVIVSIRNGKFADIRSWQLDDERRFYEEEIAAEAEPVFITPTHKR